MLPLATSTTRSKLTAARARIGYQVWFPLTVYAIARLVDLVLILIAARHQFDVPGGASYGSVASNWDGHWYRLIADHGYPAVIPRELSGQTIQNAWGFYPVYPFIVGAVMGITGLGFMVVAPIASALLGAAAVTVMYRLVAQSSGRFTASATVLLTCTYMAAPAMQIAYTESLALLLVCTALLLLRNRRYGWLIPVLVTLALTRAVALAFVPVVVVHGISRYRRRAVEPFPMPDRWRVGGIAALSVAVTALWPTIAALRTGDPAAYTQTMTSWGTTGKLPVLIQFPTFAWAEGGAAGLIVLLTLIALVAVIVLRRGARAWGPEVRAWAGFYPLYLLMATAASTTNFRHLLLAFPLFWPFPVEASTMAVRRRRLALVVLLAIFGLLLQRVWISQFLILDGTGRQPTP